MRLALVGKPLSGKGTQAFLLSQKLHLVHISLGELFRKEIQKKTVLGRQVASYIAGGKLVPTPFLLPLLIKHLPHNDFILDGVPRSLAQAQILERFWPIDLLIEIRCPNTIIFQRASARRICPGCGRIYGLHIVPQKKGICDVCKRQLEKRPDDRLKTVKERLRIYKKDTEPLVDFYTKKNRYFSVSGEESIAHVQKTLLNRLKYFGVF